MSEPSHEGRRYASQAELSALGIGSVLYSFDSNRRTYGLRGGAPIYEKYFEAEKIIGETKVSWVMERGTKLNKKTFSCPTAYGFSGYFTESMMQADIWKHHHRYEIVRLVEFATATQLKAIAEIVGYQEGEHT